MNWVKRAFTTLGNDPGAYFTVITPLEFYEWRFHRAIPKGAIFTEKMPRSDSFTDGKVIASAVLPPKALKKAEHRLEVIEEVPVMIELAVGEINSPIEMMNKFADLKQQFNRSLDAFRATTATQRYFTSIDKEPKLYRVADASVASVEVQTYGKIEDVKRKLDETYAELKAAGNKKQGRAHELEKLRRYETYLTTLRNAAVPIDAPKMDFLLTTAQLKPIQTRKISWPECYLELSTEARQMQERINTFSSMSWVKQTAKYLDRK